MEHSLYSATARFSFDSTFLAELGATNSDLLHVTGNLIVDGIGRANLALTGGDIGKSYLIAQYTGFRGGTFDNVTPGYEVLYDDVAKQIRVTPIPEPASVVLVIVGLAVCGAVVARTKRRKLGDGR